MVHYEHACVDLTTIARRRELDFAMKAGQTPDWNSVDEWIARKCDIARESAFAWAVSLDP